MASIEEKWFTWDDVEYDGERFVYFWCHLKKDIYPHKKGDFFTYISLDFKNSELFMERSSDEHSDDCPYVSCRHKMKLNIK